MSCSKGMMYKVLTADLKSGHGGKFDWTPYIDGKMTPVIDDVRMCERGYHITSDPMMWPLIGMRVFEVAQMGDGQIGGNKSIVSWVQLGPERPDLVPAYWHNVEEFVASIRDVPWFKPQGEPDPTWRVFDTMAAARDAAEDAEWEALWNTARSAAMDAAEDAARAAARAEAMDAAWDATWYAVWAVAEDAARAAAEDTAEDVAEDTAWDAVWDAARDAILYAVCVVCDWQIDRSHIDYVKARWAVWQRGYGVLCDVAGVLYVYRRP